VADPARGGPVASSRHRQAHQSVLGLHHRARGSRRIFRIRPGTLDYMWLPLRDEIRDMPDGSWRGRGLLLGREYCRFRMVPEKGTR
jgi:hypothetical protein